MKRIEISTFIEEMESIGDIWTEEQVEECYGNVTLAEALDTRKAEVGQFLSVLGKVAIYTTSKEND